MVSVTSAIGVEEPSFPKCWETMQCRRRDECPAFPDYGRACFAVTGTFCQGQDQGSYRLKIRKCRNCGFYEELMGEKR
jgi:hypothetical protein